MRPFPRMRVERPPEPEPEEIAVPDVQSELDDGVWTVRAKIGEFEVHAVHREADVDAALVCGILMAASAGAPDADPAHRRFVAAVIAKGIEDSERAGAD